MSSGCGRLTAAISVLAALSLNAGPAQSESKTVRAAVTSTMLIINKDDGHKRLLDQGENDLDASTPFSCDSANGCIIAIQAMVGISDSDSKWRICSEIDGGETKPKCPIQADGNPLFSNTGNLLKSAVVSQGAHTVQTTVKVRGFGGVFPTLKSWEVHYTIYGK